MMPVDVDELRDAAEGRVLDTSLRSAAREIGMSPSGLRQFLDGAAPYPRTLRRLTAWYARQSGAAIGEPTADDAIAALRILVRDLSPELRRSTAMEILNGLAAGYDRVGRPRPGWISAAEREFLDPET